MTTLHTCKPVPHLDARLAAAAAYVRPGHIAADIGCDHGNSVHGWRAAVAARLFLHVICGKARCKSPHDLRPLGG